MHRKLLWTALLGASICQSARAEGVLVFKGERKRNNLVSELLEVAAITKSGNTFSFGRPREGWVFIAATAQGAAAGLTIQLDGAPIDVAGASERSGTLEAVRRVAQGEHTIRVACAGGVRVDRLVVRSIPELVQCGLNTSSIRAYGPFDLAFLERDVLPNVTTLIVSPGIKLPESAINDWHRQGKRFVGEVGLNRDGRTGDANFEHYTRFLDAAPFLDGLIINEFGMNRIARPPDPVRQARAAERHRPYEEAFRRMRGDDRYKDKVIYAYFGGSGNVVNYDETGKSFVRTLIDLQYPIALERYLYERPSEEASKTALETFVSGIADWEAKEPGARENMLLTLGLFNAPPGGINKLPNVDFHVWMDQQMNVVANHATLAGIGGLNWWTSIQADEDSVRFVGKLYRHYAIDGKTERMTSDSLFLTHLNNADFANGLEGWTIEAAEEGSVAIKTFPRYGRIEGRYPRDRQPIGDTFLWMKRSAKGPNTFSQTVMNLQPGRLYSMKMFTCDYTDLTIPRKKDQAEASPFVGKVVVHGAEVDRKRSFREVYASNPEPKIPVWITYHWTVFRALGPTARLVVSDEPADNAAAAPIGQEQTFNFIEIQPYRE